MRYTYKYNKSSFIVDILQPIHSIKETTIFEENDIIQTKEVKYIECDSKGNVIIEEFILKDNLTKVIRLFDLNDNIIDTKVYSNHVLESHFKYIHTYLDGKYLVKTEDYLIQGTVPVKEETYIANYENHKISKEMRFNDKGKIIWSRLWDEKGRIVQNVFYTYSNPIIEPSKHITSHSYYEKENKIEKKTEVFPKTDNLFMASSIEKYDQNNRIISREESTENVILFNWDESSEKSIEFYKYNIDGNLIEYIKTTSKWRNKSLIDKEQLINYYNYNKMNDCVGEVEIYITDEFNNINYNNWSFQYDKINNWITRITNPQNKRIEIRTREIKYQ